MKTALFFNESDAQLVLTAESEWEQLMLNMLKKNYPDLTFEGEFYDCQGGWIRMKRTYPNYGSVYAGEETINSLMIRMPKSKEDPCE